VFREVEVEKMILRLGAAELDDLRGHQLKVVVVEAAQGEPNLGMAGRHAKSFFAQNGVRDDKSGQRLDGLQLFAFLLQIVDEHGQKFRRAVSCFGLRGVCRAPVEDEFQAERGGGKTTFLHHHFAFFDAWQVVQSKGYVGFDLLKLWVVEDGLCTLPRLFGGLEEQHYLALVGTLFAKPLCQAAEDGGVSVVAAFVRNALALRAIGEVVRLRDMQRVDVASDEDTLAGLGTFIYGGQSIAADFLDELVGVGLFHPFIQDFVGQRLVPRKLGMGVEDMSKFDEVLHRFRF